MKNFKNLTAVFALILFASVNASAQQTAAPAKSSTPAPKTETKAPSTTAALPKADEIIDKFVAATGGEAAYKKANSYHVKGTMEIPAAGVKGTYESFQKAPNKSAVFINIPGLGQMIEIFDGSKAWASDPIQGTREKTAEELAQTKLDSDFYRFARLKELFPKRETKGIEKIEGSDAYAVVMTAGDVSQTYYFDQKTNLLVRVDQIAVTPQGKIPVQTFLSDYRKFEGVLMPYTMRVDTASGGFTFKTEEIKSNMAIDDAKFAKPTK
ncbi:MAG TPA: hypothetical protein VGB02_01615 [Pyrinomonadaceae bacterium]|jgi:hypothetical protein